VRQAFAVLVAVEVVDALVELLVLEPLLLDAGLLSGVDRIRALLREGFAERIQPPPVRC
jgi:hypothetical protein